MKRTPARFVSLPLFQSLLPQRRAALWGYEDADYQPLSAVIKKNLAMRLDIFTAWGGLTKRLHSIRSHLEFVILDFSRFEDSDDVVTIGFGIRRAAPELPAVFILNDIQRDDFSRERSAICDASLKVPFGEASVLLGIHSAIENRRHMLQGMQVDLNKM